MDARIVPIGDTRHSEIGFVIKFHRCGRGARSARCARRIGMSRCQRFENQIDMLLGPRRHNQGTRNAIAPSRFFRPQDICARIKNGKDECPVRSSLYLRGIGIIFPFKEHSCTRNGLARRVPYSALDRHGIPLLRRRAMSKRSRARQTQQQSRQCDEHQARLILDWYGRQGESQRASHHGNQFHVLTTKPMPDFRPSRHSIPHAVTPQRPFPAPRGHFCRFRKGDISNEV